MAELRESVAACVFINPLVKPPPAELLEGLEGLLSAAGVETIDSIGSDIKKEGAFETSYPATPLAPAEESL